VIAPTWRLCLLAVVPLVPAATLFIEPETWPAVLVADVLVLAVALADLTTLPGRSGLHVRREMQPIATRGAAHPVTLVVENRWHRPIDLTVIDDRPASLQIRDAIRSSTLSAGTVRRLSFRIVPTERGEIRFERVFVRCRSMLRLWHAYRQYAAADVLHVYPALKQIGRYALFARSNRMSMLGVRRSRRIGGDNEFERLRDYKSDDPFKTIDWRATARRLKCTVREHQSNQSQRIVFAIDCGRMMVNRTAGESLLDAALDAALTLAHVALTQRDEAGMLCFDESVTRWLPPRAGHRQLNRMVAATHDVQPRLVESRSDRALLHLQRRCRKRTLLVVLTNVIDDRNAERLRGHLAPTVGRHLPLVVLLRDSGLFAAVNACDAGRPDTDPRLLQRAGAAADILLWRRQVLERLEADGILTLDARAEDLTAALVSAYLSFKARRLL